MTDFRQVRVHARQATRDAALPALSRGEFDAARRRTQSTLDLLLRPVPASTLAAVACARGCAMCCHLRVAAMPVEVFGVARYLRQQFDAPALAAVGERIRDAAARVHAQPRAQLLAVNIACPLLDAEGGCSVYPARPLNCRAYHSLDLEACRAAFADPEDMGQQHPQSAWMGAIHAGAQQGLRDGLQQLRVDTTQYELVTALAEALDDPGCEQRHAAGAQAFRRAIVL